MSLINFLIRKNVDIKKKNQRQNKEEKEENKG